jgi:hypothetical protein
MRTWVLLLALLASGLAIAGCPGKKSDKPGGVKVCPRTMCGSPPEMPAYECGDGAPGGPSGRCVADEFDACDWEILVCSEEASDCVVAGCEDNLCVESGTDILDECEYGDLLECEIRGICERQEDGECGFTETEEVLRCKKFGD